MHVRDIVSIEGSVENIWRDLSIISCSGFESMYSGLEKLEEKREKRGSRLISMETDEQTPISLYPNLHSG